MIRSRVTDRFDYLVQLYKPKSEVPAFLTCVDIAGLTKGASTGAGLGNNFLANVRAVDGIFQVVRAYHAAARSSLLALC